MDEDVRKILALSAQMDELMRIHSLGRITKEDYDRRLSELRGRCAFRAVDLDDSPIVRQQYRTH